MLSFLKNWIPCRRKRTTVTIDVTWDDIRNARPEDGRVCPIALAAKRVIPADTICVSSYHITMEFGKVRVKRGLPEEAETFVSRYDYGLMCSPLSFDFSYWVPREAKPYA